jgi:hypothetical protein
MPELRYKVCRSTFMAAFVVSPEISCYDCVTIQTYTNLRKTQKHSCWQRLEAVGKKIGVLKFLAQISQVYI